MISKKSLYWFIRTHVALIGAISISSGFLAMFAPELISSGYKTELKRTDIIYFLWLILYGALLITPHGWFLKKPLFMSKLIIISIGSLSFVWLGITGIHEYLNGGKDPLIIPFSIASIFLIITGPLSMYLRSKKT